MADITPNTDNIPLVDSTDRANIPNEPAQPSTPTTAPTAPNTPDTSISSGENRISRPATPSASISPQKPKDGTTGSAADLVNAAKTNQEEHPSLQRAGLFHSIAEKLAGGPRYKIESDVNTGEIKRTPVPMSGRDIAMAIAFEAITGGLAGLAGGKGRGAGAAGIAGMEQGRKIVQARRDAENQQMQEAQQNLSRHYQVTEANMRMYSLAQTIGRMDQEMHDNMVKSSSDYLAKVRDNTPELIVDERVSEADAKDVSKYPMNEYIRVPDGVTPRQDADGNQAYVDHSGKLVSKDTPGAHPAWDNTYSMVHRNAKVNVSDENGSADFVKQAIGWGLLDKSWMKAAPGSQMSGALGATLSRKVDSLNAAKSDLDHYYSVLNTNASDGKPGKSGGKPGNGVTLSKLFTDDNGNPDFERLANAFIKHESPNAGDRGLRNNNPGNLKNGKFTKALPGYAGTDGTFAKFDTAEHGREALVAMLKRDMSKYGDLSPQGYVEAAYSPDSDNAPGQSKAYGDFLLKQAGFDPNAEQGESTSSAPAAPPKYAPVDLQAEIKKDPTLATALDKYQGMLNQTGSREQALGELAKKDPRAAGKIARIYGGRDALHDFDMQQKVRDLHTVNNEKLDAEMEKKKAEEAAIVTRNDRLIDAMIAGKKFDLYHIATMRAYDREVIVNEAIKRAEQRGIEWNPEDVKSRIELYSSAGASKRGTSGTFANSVMNAKTSLGHMGGAMDALERLKAKHPELTSIKFMNKGMQELNDQFGNDPDWTAYKVELHTATTDWQNLLNNQHALTETDKAWSNDLGSTTAPFKNTISGLQEMAHTAAVRIVPLNDMWKSMMGADYPDLLNDEAVRAIKRIGNPEIVRLLGDMQVGGNLRGSSDGTGTPGKKVSDLLGKIGGAPTNKPQPAPDGTVINDNGVMKVKQNGQWEPYQPGQSSTADTQTGDLPGAEMKPSEVMRRMKTRQ